MTETPYAHFPVVIAAPSGTGKTTLARNLVERFEGFCFSVSATTRPPRRGETSGVDYHFVGRAVFEDMVANGELAEWAEVHGRMYGTPRAELDAAKAAGEHVVLDIDVQGARQIRRSVPESVLVFVLPPSVDGLMDRLRGRGTESSQELARRLQSALDELAAAPEFDYVVVNDDMEACLDEIRGIVQAEARRFGRVGQPDPRVEALRSEVDRILREEFNNPSE